MDRAKALMLQFVQRMQVPPADITEIARPLLEALGNNLLGVIRPDNFPADHKRIVNQYSAVFQQRVESALRDTEIGFDNESRFTGMSESETWITADQARNLLKTGSGSLYNAQVAICKRAHAGLMRARAEQFHQGQRTFHNHDIPKEFWWAEGHQALEQDWATGDFSTWIERGSVQLKAFGVTFARADIQKLLPPPNSVTTSNGCAHRRR